MAAADACGEGDSNIFWQPTSVVTTTPTASKNNQRVAMVLKKYKRDITKPL